MVEGVLNDLLIEKISFSLMDKRYLLYKDDNISKTKSNKLKFEINTLLNLIENIENATWVKLVNFFKLVFDKKIDEIVSPNLYEGINTQFSLRNMISHGNTIKVEYLNDAEGEKKIEFNKKYEKVYNYLIKRKLVKKTQLNNLELTRIFNNEATDHFVRNSMLFIEELSGKLEAQDQLIRAIDITRFFDPIKKLV